MASIYNYISRGSRWGEAPYITEGGAAGHMSHPYDYDDLTLRALKGMVRNLFEGKVEDITEKIDGMNIQATLDPAGQVRFIRNKGDLNGTGMSVQDMADKWASRPQVRDTFVSAGKIIEQAFKPLGTRFFNPDSNTKIYVNCECVNAGKTNIMPYPSSKVFFHDLWVYVYNTDGWVKKEVTKRGLGALTKAAEKMDSCMPTPKVIIRQTEESKLYINKFIRLLDKTFKEAGCKERDTVLDYKKARYKMLAPEWISASESGSQILFNRWFLLENKPNIRDIRKYYPDHIEELNMMDKVGRRDLTEEVMAPLVSVIRSLGCVISDMCGALINSKPGTREATIQALRDEISDVTDYINTLGSEAAKEKMARLLDQFHDLGDFIPPTEGIVFRFGDKLMKLTGSFAVINKFINMKYMDKE